MYLFLRIYEVSYLFRFFLTIPYTNIEIIIVNDSSEDSTLKLLEKYYSNPSIIILSNILNYGCYTSINIALNFASGDYITIHGSDDVSFKYRIETMIKKMLDSNLLMCGTYILRTHLKSFDSIDLSNSMNIFTSIVLSDNPTKIYPIHTQECCKPLISLGTLMYHKSVFKKLGEYENIRKGGDMVFVEKFLYQYENIKFFKNDCSHRYLTKILSGSSYQIIDDILYLSLDNNITDMKKLKKYIVENYNSEFSFSELMSEGIPKLFLKIEAVKKQIDKLISASDDLAIKIWGLKSGECLKTLEENENWVILDF